mgnify:CR=1 FL=1|jgi:bacillithiol system protein YtxJ
MNWTKLTNPEQLSYLKDSAGTALIFKHSTRCSISNTVLSRLERNWNEAEMQQITPYYLDLLTYRNISDKIAELFEVQHESPQVLIIRKGKSVYHASHFDIGYEHLKAVVRN